MMKYFERTPTAAGQPAPSMVHIGERGADTPQVQIVEFNEKQHAVRELRADAPNFKEALRARAFGADAIAWVNVDAINDNGAIQAVAEQYALHPLVVEDVLQAAGRSKLEEYDDTLFILLKMLDWDEKSEQIVVEQISIVICQGAVITFQNRVGDVFDDVRDRLRNNKGRIRKLGADYLSYALIDAIVDHYFLVLEKMGEWIEKLDRTIEDDPNKIDAAEIHVLKRELLFLRKAIWPARETIGSLARLTGHPLITAPSEQYFRDVHDHLLQVTESIEVMRESMNSVMDTYHATLSTKMNGVMKVLTVISTIFIPLTFVAGIYGMNFSHMPELVHPNGYFYCLIGMAIVSIFMIGYIKWNRWM
jgi:magnesium transporter